MQVAYAMFAASTAPEGSRVECMIDHEVRTLTSIGPQYYTNARNWLTACYLAVICREYEKLEHLCSIPVDLLRSAGESEGAQYDQYIYHWVAALQSYFLKRGKTNTAEELAAALELSHPERAQVGSAEMLNKRSYPPIGLFHLYLRRKIPEFNGFLAEALELHKQYFTASEERRDNLDGAVPLGILAISCLAYDAGYWDPEFQITVRSEYLPQALLQRAWRGEFPT